MGRLLDMEATSLRFAAAARTLGQVARQQGLQVPGFRSPPRIAEVDRTLRRRPDGGALVAVRLKGRPWVAVLADMIDGMIATNYLDGADAARFRTRLWTAVETDSTRSAPPTRAQRLARVRAATTPSFNPVADQSQVA